jgi:transcriptional regulator GlxA family with amidase domain
MMPRVDGYEMTRRIRQDQITSHIPIIMLTAKAADEDKFEGLERGVDAYLTKPFNKKELRIRVRKLIELRRQLRQRAGVKAVLSPSEIEASSMDQEFLQRVQECIEKNMENENFGVDDLAAQIGVGKRQLQRKLKALIDSSPQQCVRTMRLQRARQLLERGAGTISEIAFQVGYSEGSALARAFREEFGFAPSEIKSPKEK